MNNNLITELEERIRKLEYSDIYNNDEIIMGVGLLKEFLAFANIALKKEQEFEAFKLKVEKEIDDFNIICETNKERLKERIFGDER